MFAKIKSIEILPDFKIKALFDCNVVKIYDFNLLIQNHQTFKLLQQNNLFKQAKVDSSGYGICWTDDIDIDSSEIWHNGTTLSENEPTNI